MVFDDGTRWNSVCAGLRGHATKSLDNVTVRDKRFRREYPLRCDLLVEGCLIVEVKASESVDSNEQKLTEGVSRLILPGANLE